MARWLAIGTTVALSMLGTVAVGQTTLAHGHDGPTAAQARQVVVEFFRSQNERQYDRTCRLLSPGFYAEHRLTDRPTCEALLRVGFMWSGQIVFRIRSIERARDRFTVRATADGAPGRIVLVRDGDDLKILGVHGERPGHLDRREQS